MNREYTLTEAELEFFRLAREEDARLRKEYLAALGVAKEAEIASAALAASRDQQLAIIAKNAALPPGNLKFSSDGFKLIVEPVEPPAAGPQLVPPVSFEERAAKAAEETEALVAATRQRAATEQPGELVNGVSHGR